MFVKVTWQPQNNLCRENSCSKLFKELGFYKGIWQLEQENQQGLEVLRQQGESLVNNLYQKSRNLMMNKRINMKDESVIVGFTA